MAKRNTSSKRQNPVAAPEAEVIASPVAETSDSIEKVVPEQIASEEVAPEQVASEEVAPEQVAAEAGATLRSVAEKYEIPERTGGPNNDRHEILSISGFREIGGVMHAIAYCDDRCTYDVPLTAKPE